MECFSLLTGAIAGIPEKLDRLEKSARSRGENFSERREEQRPNTDDSPICTCHMNAIDKMAPEVTIAGYAMVRCVLWSFEHHFH
jgi:hypothetical protein